MKQLLKIKTDGTTRYLDVNMIERVVFTGDKDISIVERELYKETTNITKFRNVENMDEVVEQLEALVPRVPSFVVSDSRVLPITNSDDSEFDPAVTLTFANKYDALLALKSRDMAIVLFHLLNNERKRMLWKIGDKKISAENTVHMVFDHIVEMIKENGLLDLIEGNL